MRINDISTYVFESKFISLSYNYYTIGFERTFKGFNKIEIFHKFKVYQ